MGHWNLNQGVNEGVAAGRPMTPCCLVKPTSNPARLRSRLPIPASGGETIAVDDALGLAWLSCERLAEGVG